MSQAPQPMRSGHLVRAVRGNDEQPQLRELRRQRHQELERRLVRPLHVVGGGRPVRDEARQAAADGLEEGCAFLGRERAPSSSARWRRSGPHEASRGRSGSRAGAAARSRRLRFLIDNGLSPVVAERLQAAGHDAVHVRDYGLAAVTDEEVFARAAEEERTVVSADTDFGTLLALRHARRPSVLLFRHGAERRPDRQVALMLANLDGIEKDLIEGCVIVLEPRTWAHSTAAPTHWRDIGMRTA